MQICMDCGNEDRFFKEATGSKTVYGRIEYNGREEEIDNEIEDEGDIEWDNEEEVQCGECESSNVEDGLTVNELERLKWKHTDREGEWSEIELDEKERDEEVGEQLLVEDI